MDISEECCHSSLGVEITIQFVMDSVYNRINSKLRKRIKKKNEHATKTLRSDQRKKTESAGHVMRRTNRRITKRAVKQETSGKKGHPQETLKRTLTRKAMMVGIKSLNELEMHTKNRGPW